MLSDLLRVLRVLSNFRFFCFIKSFSRASCDDMPYLSRSRHDPDRAFEADGQAQSIAGARIDLQRAVLWT